MATHFSELKNLRTRLPAAQRLSRTYFDGFKPAYFDTLIIGLLRRAQGSDLCCFYKQSGNGTKYET
jgi:hypothetical protein